MSAATIDRSGCPAPQHGKYWMRNNLGCVCFDARVDQAAYRAEQRRGEFRRVPSLAATRIVQGLARHGFGTAGIAAMSGLSERAVKALQAGRQPTVLRGSDEALRRVADWVRLDVAPSGYAASRARLAARNNGWAPLPAWDPEDLDDPSATPRLGLDGDDEVDEVAVSRRIGGELVRLSRPERLEAVRLLLDRGLSQTEASKRLHLSGSTVAALAASLADMSVSAA